MSMRKLGFLLVVLLVAGAWHQSTHGQDGAELNSQQWPPAENPEVDLSFLLEKPAGARGFLTVCMGHLATADGDRFRIWGIDLTAAMVTRWKGPSGRCEEKMAGASNWKMRPHPGIC